METSPAPCPAAATEPRVRHPRPRRLWASARPSFGVERPPLVCRARADPCAPTGAHGAGPGQERHGSTRAGSGRRAGEEPSSGQRGHGQCEPAADGGLSVSLSVGHRAWSTALTGCQAIPLHVLRGLLVLEGKVWPLPLVSETCPASLRSKPLPKALPVRRCSPPRRLWSSKDTLPRSSLACSTGEQHDTKPMARHQDPPRGLARIPPSSSEGTEVQQVPQSRPAEPGGHSLKLKQGQSC